MGFQLGWLIEGRIVITELNGKLNRREAEVIAGEVFDLIKGYSAGQVHYVIDLTQLNHLEISLGDLPKEGITPPQSLNWVVFISDPQQKVAPTVKFLASVAAQQMNTRVRFFETRSAAFDFLYSMDDSLDQI